MKSIIRLLMFFTIYFLGGSCSKNDDNAEIQANSGSMTYLSKTYNFSEARIIAQSDQNGVYRYAVAIYADDVKWTNGTFSKGHYLSISFYCNSSSGIAAGTYSENPEDSYLPMTANSTTFFTISSEYPYSSYTRIHPAKITMKVSGSTYDLTITGADFVDRTFSATYKGIIKKM